MPQIQPYKPADLTTALTPPPLPTVQPTTSTQDANIGSFANQWQPGDADTYGWRRRTSTGLTG